MERDEPFSCTLSLEDRENEDGGKTKKPATTSNTLSQKLGLEDFTSLQIWRESLAELVGVAVLTFAMNTMVIGTIETDKQSPNLLLSILVALILTIIFLAVFPVSGGHLNPAISFTIAFVGFISISRAFIYTLAQCLGAVLGSLAFKAVISSEIENHFSLGGCTLGIIEPGPNGPITIGLGTSEALWLEIFSTFVVLFAGGSIGFIRSPTLTHGPVFMFSIISVMVGVMTYVTTTVTMVKGYTGAGMNPARCVGPAIVMGGHLFDRHWVFWVGPFIGAVVFYVYTKIVPNQYFYGKHDHN